MKFLLNIVKKFETLQLWHPLLVVLIKHVWKTVLLIIDYHEVHRQQKAIIIHHHHHHHYCVTHLVRAAMK